MLLCCLRRNVEASCHKHFVVVSREKQMSSTSVINLPRSVAAVCIALGSRTVHSTRWSQILVENRDFAYPPAFDAAFGGFRRNIAITFGAEKLEWCAWLPIVKNLNICIFNVTDGQTPHDGIGRTYA